MMAAIATIGLCLGTTHAVSVIPSKATSTLATSHSTTSSYHTDSARKLYSDGIMDLRFSLWHPTWKADEPMEQGAFLANEVIFAIQKYLCQETDFILVSSSILDGSMNMCTNGAYVPARRLSTGTYGLHNQNLRKVRSLQEEQADEKQTIISTQGKDIEIIDREDQGIYWTTWTLYYSIVQVSPLYLDQATIQQQQEEFDLSNETSQTSTTDATPEMMEAAMKVMDNVGQLALDVGIVEGNLDQLLDGKVTAYFSVVGEEVDTFARFAFTQTESNDQSEMIVFMRRNLLRLLGAGLMFCVILTTASLMLLARQRRSIREKCRRKKKTDNTHSAYNSNIRHDYFTTATDNIAPKTDGRVHRNSTMSGSLRNVDQMLYASGTKIQTHGRLGPQMPKVREEYALGHQMGDCDDVEFDTGSLLLGLEHHSVICRPSDEGTVDFEVSRSNITTI